MDTIFIHDLRIETKVGVYAWERELPQTVRIDLDIALPSRRAFETGELADAIDYAAVVSRIGAFVRHLIGKGNVLPHRSPGQQRGFLEGNPYIGGWCR